MFNILQALAGMFFELTAVSHNRKTGPIATARSSMNTCPDDCPLKNNGCYANRQPLLHWWKLVPTRGTSLDGFVKGLRRLVKGSMLRLQEAGDFPGADNHLFRDACLKIAKAAAHLKTWTYTHYRPERGENEDIIREMNRHITVNLSANDFREADSYFALQLPVVCTVPADFPAHGIKTPDGNQVAICPFETGKVANCQQCGNGDPLCFRQNRNYIIGFRGKTSARKIRDIFLLGLKRKRGLTIQKKGERLAA